MKRRVAVIYHFFAHYRQGIITELVQDPRHEWTFYGDTHDFSSNIKPYVFPPNINYVRLKVVRLIRNVIWQWGIVRIAASRDHDTLILLGVSKHLSMWVAAIVGRLTGKRVLFWTHGWTYRPKGPLRYVRRAFYMLAHSIMTYGHWAKQIGLEEGFKPKQLHVIGNCLDLRAQNQALLSINSERKSQIRIELFGEDKVPSIACTSRLIEVRRLDLLFHAVCILRQNGKNCNIILVGDGPERAKLEALAKRLGIKVAFIGAFYDEKRIGEFLLASNLTVAPGMVGLTAMHSMAFGIPVVSHGNAEKQMPEFEAIIPGKTGSLFREGDLESLAEAIGPWVEHQWCTPETRSHCRDIIDRFWSPWFQLEAICRAVEGQDADDLFFMRNTRTVFDKDLIVASKIKLPRDL